MVPAAKVAKGLGLNSKTVQRYFNRLCLKITEESRRSLKQLAGEIEVDESYFDGVQKGKRGRGAGGKIPVLGLLKRHGEARVVFPDKVDKASLQGAIKTHMKPQSWVYSDGFRAYDNFDLEGLHHVRIIHDETLGQGKTHINEIENFWGFIKRRLKIYHGGYKKNFELFIRKMGFRFNHRSNPNVINDLYKMLKFDPI
ncbi:MAG: IS1595 family transposase [Desulfobacterales bacterium]|nr:IS1595 family transposase [Desulfobacterales bacterium]